MTTPRPIALPLAVPAGSLGAHDVQGLVTEVECRWLAASRHWVAGREVVVEDEAVRVIGRAVLAWAGIRSSLRVEDAVAHRLAEAGDPRASAGARALHARWSRRRLERWATTQVRAARNGRPSPPPGSLLDVLVGGRDLEGHLVTSPNVARDFLGVLQPVVALSGLVAVGARELVRRPGWRGRLRAERGERAPGSGPDPWRRPSRAMSWATGDLRGARAGSRVGRPARGRSSMTSRSACSPSRARCLRPPTGSSRRRRRASPSTASSAGRWAGYGSGWSEAHWPVGQEHAR